MSNTYHQSLQPELFGITGALLVLASVAVALRLFSRKLSAASFWWDDYTIVIALILYYGLTACYWTQAISGGSGRHTEAAGGPVNQAMIVKFFQSFMAIQIMYFSTSVTFKSSLILLYYRIFGVARWFRTMLILVETIVACYFTVCLFVAIFECRPASYYWDKTIRNGSCINQTQFYRWNGVANLLIDFMILSLTFPMVWRLQISLRQKITLSGIFALGTFVCITSIIRVTSFDQLHPDDESYTGVEPALWSEAEQSLGIVCSCLICLRPLVGRLRVGSRQENTNSSAVKSRDVRLRDLSGKRSARGGESIDGIKGTGFTRLPELRGDLAGGGVRTEATTAARHEEGLGDDTILRSQEFEIHSDDDVEWNQNHWR